jgi:hypothetical protein
MKNPAKIVFAVACTSASIDQQSNNVSLFNILEDVQFNATFVGKRSDQSENIAVPFPFSLVILFARVDTSKTERSIPVYARISVVDPSNKILSEIPVEGSIEATKKRFRMTVQFNGLTVTKSGTYSFKVSLLNAKDEKETVQDFDLPLDIAINISEVKENITQ